MGNQPNVKAVIGTLALATKMAEFDAKKFVEFSGKGGDKKGGKQEKKMRRNLNKKRRKRKRRKKPPKKLPRCPRRKRILWMSSPRETWTWTNGSDSTPTTTRTIPSSGS